MSNEQAKPLHGLSEILEMVKQGDICQARDMALSLDPKERIKVERAIRIRSEIDSENRETGRRFTMAREMNGMSQISAAEVIGYQNSAPLSKIEAGIAPAPIWLYRRAAEVYGVSTDYLHGLSTYPERDARTVEQVAILASVKRAMQKSAEHITECAIVAAAEAVPFRSRLAEYDVAVRDAVEAMRIVRESNKSFDDRTRGGARLVRSIDSLASIASSVANLENRKRMIKQESADLMAASQGRFFTLLFEGQEENGGA